MILVIPQNAFTNNINRLTNQIWKLIPMRENNENWKGHLEIILTEIIGIKDTYMIGDENILILITKLKGLLTNDIGFDSYRNTVFKCISLLRQVGI